MDSAVASDPSLRSGSRTQPRALSNLLLVVAAMVFAMVVIGGITRLTESGLSITQWNVVSGALPPLTHSDWVRLFDLYKQTPQYREVAGPAGMTLAGFKFIFFWEWVHRLLGRIIGLVFFVGVGWFALKRAIPKGYDWSELSWTREDDAPINLSIKSMGAKVYKKYRVYTKPL